MKVLVTGGAGFIGSHIVDKLINRGHEVIVIDNLSTGKMENVNPDSVFYCLNISSSSLHKIFAEEKPQFVIHAAAQVSVPNSFKDPILDCTTNIIGTLNVLECCRKYQVKKIVYSSSAAVYGEPQYLPIDENHNVCPQSNYGVSKYTAENYIKVYNHLYGINYTILRYSNVYGTRQESKSEGGVIAVFLERIFNNKPPVIFGTGNQIRDFIFVDDVAEANIIALSKGNNEVLNISTNKSTSINGLIETIETITGVNIITSYSRSSPGDIYISILGNSKSKEILEWLPRYSLTDGLQQTLKVKEE